MRHWGRKIAFLLGILLLGGGIVGIAVGWPDYFAREIAPYLMEDAFSPGELSEQSGEVSNPYRGWYRLFGYVLDDTGRGVLDLDAHLREADYPLVQIEINLRNYASGEISGAALSELSLILDAWEASGHQVILRFAYDFNGYATRYEPTDVAVVLGHISQVAPVVNAHSKSVFTMQGLFVGECGEMHGTPLCTDDNYVRLYAALEDAIDDAVFLSVRTPSHFAAVTGISQEAVRNASVTELSEWFGRGDATGETLRLGLFNDGMLGSGNDLGTYEDRAEGIAFQERLCLFAPNGGEVVVDNPYNDLDNALSDMAEMHISYLNVAHDGAVVEKWRRSPMPSDEGAAEDGFSYITAHLGYRFVVTDVMLEASDVLRFSLMVENRGFAPAYVPFTATVQVRDQEGAVVQSVVLPGDVRDWRPGEVASEPFEMDATDWAEGEYTLYVSLYDERQGCAISFANASQGGEGVCLGTLQRTHRDVDAWDYGKVLLWERLGIGAKDATW